MCVCCVYIFIKHLIIYNIGCLKQEETRLSEVHFSNLLLNKVSHKCLLACAMEVVMAAYSSNSCKYTER